jgi:hypothetical protein
VIIYGNGASQDNRPVITENNLVAFDNITATSENPLLPATNAANGNTNLRWESQSSDEQYLTSEFDVNSSVDYLAIAGHNFGESGAAVSVEVLVSAVWTEVVEPNVLGDNNPTILKFDEVSCDGVRLKMASSTFTPTVTVLFSGLTLQLQRNIYVGHSPIEFGRNNSVVTGMSESGQFIGRIVIGKEHNTVVDMENITPQFYRDKIDTFFKNAPENTFFFAWRPMQYPNEVSYSWIKEDGRVTNQRPNGMMNISFPVGGIVEGGDIATAQPTVRNIIFDTNQNDVNLRTVYDSLFPTPLDTTILNVSIENGVTIGSTSALSAGFEVGTWPSGTTITINNDGILQGAGGAGGSVGVDDGNGQNGGKALDTGRAVTLDLSGGGVLYDGAGGGGASDTDGGGGGAGSVVGVGGTGATNGSDGTALVGGAGGGVGTGDGGDFGQIGNDGTHTNGGLGGDSGCSIDTNPLITVVGAGSGDVEGCNTNSISALEIDITTNQTDYNLRTEYDLVHPTPSASTVLNVYVRNGVVINSSATTIPAFDVGSWPVGANINLFVNGTIKGSGGDGGSDGSLDGGDGGDAFLTTFPVSIDFENQGSGADGLIASGGGGGESLDEGYGSNVSLIIHCDGADGSTVFTDESQYSHPITTNGNAQVDTSQSKFGGASLLVDGSGDYLSIPQDASFATTDFTISAWIRQSSSSSASNIYRGILDNLPWNSTLGEWSFGTNRLNQVYFYIYDGSDTYYETTALISNDVWHNIAVSRSGSSLKIFIDGVEVLSATQSQALIERTTHRIGLTNISGSTGYFNGHIDEILFTNNALYTSSFTPPTAPFAPSIVGGGGGAGNIVGAGGIGDPTPANDGNDGTSTTGGAGGTGAGAGGDLGQDGFDNTGTQGGAGSGSAGNAIDGISNVTIVNPSDGTITGPQVN